MDQGNTEEGRSLMDENEKQFDMYDTEDFEPAAASSDTLIGATNKGMVTEIDINGKKFDVVNPEYAKELQRVILDMSNKMRVMDRTLRSMDFLQKQQARIISNLQTQLDGKIDRG